MSFKEKKGACLLLFLSACAALSQTAAAALAEAGLTAAAKAPPAKAQTAKAAAAKASRSLKQDNRRIRPFPFIYNREVQHWIHIFSGREAAMALWLARSARYFPMMKRILSQYGPPQELACVTLVESGLSAFAVSRAQAVGYWQFIAPTARRFQLTVNDWLDERRDFEKSARAAARYLEALNREFNDWPLNLAAYNMGEARLRRLIKKYKTRDFWRLARKRDFPRETAHYVPKIFAASHILKSPESRGFTQFSILKPYQYDLFYVPGGMDIQTLAEQTGKPIAELKALNPELKTGRIPENVPNHRIRLPKGTAPFLSAYLDKKRRSAKPSPGGAAGGAASPGGDRRGGSLPGNGRSGNSLPGEAPPGALP